MNRWFEAKIYIYDEYRTTTVYWMPADSPLVQGVNRREVRRPIEPGEIFCFDSDPDGQGQQCVNPFAEDGWQLIPQKENQMSQIPDKGKPVLARIVGGDAIPLDYYEVVYHDGKQWRAYFSSTTFEDGEQVIEWRYAADCFQQPLPVG
jgi:hypothetical protein